MEPEGSLSCSHQGFTCPYLTAIWIQSMLLFKILINIVFPSTPKSPKWPLSLRVLHKKSVCISLLPHISRSSYPPWYDPIIISWGIQIFSSSSGNFHQPPAASSHLVPNVFLSTLFLNTLSQCSSLNIRDQVSHSFITKSKNAFLNTMVDTKLEDKRS
jgi:hypothetical protein